MTESHTAGVFLELTSDRLAPAAFARVLSQAGEALVDRAEDADVIIADQPPAGAGRAAKVVVVADTTRGGREAFSAGAVGVLTSDDATENLPAALSAVRAGLLVLSPALRAAVGRPALTRREKQVLALVVMGLSNAEIAEKLVLSDSTVKSHLFSAYRRMGVKTRTQAVALITDPVHGFGTGILSIPQE